MKIYKDYPYKVTVPIGEVGNKVIVDDDGFIIPYPTSTTVIKGVRPWDDKRYLLSDPFKRDAYESAADAESRLERH